MINDDTDDKFMSRSAGLLGINIDDWFILILNISLLRFGSKVSAIAIDTGIRTGNVAERVVYV